MMQSSLPRSDANLQECNNQEYFECHYQLADLREPWPTSSDVFTTCDGHLEFPRSGLSHHCFNRERHSIRHSVL